MFKRKEPKIVITRYGVKVRGYKHDLLTGLSMYIYKLQELGFEDKEIKFAISLVLPKNKSVLTKNKED